MWSILYHTIPTINDPEERASSEKHGKKRKCWFFSHLKQISIVQLHFFCCLQMFALLPSRNFFGGYKVVTVSEVMIPTSTFYSIDTHLDASTTDSF